MSKLPKNLKDVSIALIYDRVTTKHGGAEKVLVALHELFPNAPLFTSVYDSDNTPWADAIQVIPSWLQRIPFAKKNHRWLLPLLPITFENFDLSSYHLIISVTSAEAKGVITLPHQLHICYLLTPTRYLYSHHQTYLESSKRIFPGFKKLTTKILEYIRWWDQVASSRPDAYIPISKLVATRLEKYYKQKAKQIVYPPVEEPPNTMLDTKKIPANFKEYFIIVSRFVPYKKIDLAIKATQKLGKKLIIVGDGPDKKKLKELATSSSKPENIVFFENQSKQEVSSLLKNAKALIMPGIEDFGIIALESLTVETPVLIHKDSGVAEIIKNTKTGTHLQELTVNGLIEGIEQLEQTSFSIKEMKKTVAKYNTAQFKNNIQQVVTTLWKEHYVKYT